MANYQDNFAVFFTADTSKLSQGVDKMLSKFGTTDDKVKALKKQFTLLGKEWDNTGTEAEQLERNLKNLKDGLDNTGTAPLQAMYAFQQFSQSLNQLSGQLSKINNDITEQTEGLEQKMANIQATMGRDIDTAGLEKLEREIRDTAIRIGESSIDIAEKVTDALSAGVDKDVVVEMVELAGMAARGTRGTLDTMVDLGNTVRNTYGTANEEIFDLISRTYQLGDITGQEIAQGFGMVGGGAKEAGIAVDDLFQAIAVGSKKVRPEQLFTGLNAAISELNTSGSQAEKMLQDLGYANLQTALETKTFVEIASELNLSGEKMVDVFGRQAARAINAVGGDMEDATRIMEGFNDVQGKTNELFDDASRTNQFLREQQVALANELRTSIGENLLPVQNEWLNIQNKILETLIKTSPEVQKFAGGLIFATSKLGEFVSGAGALAHNVYAVSQAVTLLKSANLATHFMTITKALWAKVTALKAAFVASQALQMVGLAGAIAFTTVQIVKLIGAINDYRGALADLEATTQNQIKQNEALVDGSEAKLLATRRDLRMLKEHEEGVNKLSRVERERIVNSLKALGVEADGKRSIANLNAVLAKTEEALAKVQAEGVKRRGDVSNKIAKQEQDNKKEIIELTEEEKTANKEFARIQREQAEAEAEIARKAIEQYKEKVQRQIDITQEQIRRIAGLELQREINNASSLEREFELKRQYRQREYENDIRDINNTIEIYQTRADTLTDIEQEHLEALKDLRLNSQMALANDIDALRAEELEAIDNFNRERQEKEDAHNAYMLQKSQDFMNKYNDIATNSGEVFAGVLTANQDKQREGLKSLLNNLIDFVEKQLLAGIASAGAQSLLSGGILAPGMIAQLAMVKGLLGVARAGVASFDVGGIPMGSGLGMLHKGDVVVNPTTDNKMMSALVDKIGEKLNARQNIQLRVDKRILGEVVVEDVNQQNKKLPSGRSVFDDYV